jgi:DNA-binding NarL/FixJ family response regulator
VQRVRVAVEAPDPITVAGLSAQLASRPEISTLAPDAIAEADVLVLCADVVNAEVIRRLRALPPTSRTRTVLVACEVRPEDALSLVECRVVAVLPRTHATQERLIRVVLGARAGHGALPPDMLGALLQQVAELQQLALTVGLTPSGLGDRERDVLRLVADGFNTAEIAARLCYSERTVKNILYNVVARLRVRNRSHAVAAAIRAGVI